MIRIDAMWLAADTIDMRAGTPEDFERVGIAGVRQGDGTVVDLRLPR